ncbi:DUF695 domain-containing protein [Stutzerimonas zhaodongensis]|uniref:DUF695 domain-containing protein n=1 Tax=Stutzerimonas TaxID=2901164 RepID=UPI00388E6761
MENWDFYQANINDRVASIYLDLSFAVTAPDSHLPKLAWYWIKMDHPRSDGLSSDEELDRLNEHEDELISHLSNTRTKYVGRITTQGRREFYFYISEESSVQDVLRALIGENPRYLYQIGEKADPSWHHYFDVLYPGPNGLSQIKSRNA